MGTEVDHIGVVVDDIVGAVTFLRDAFGLTVERSVAVEEFSLSASFLRWGGVSIELIEHADPARREAALKGARAAIDHIAIAVEDIDATVVELVARGVRTMTPAPFVLAGRRTIFLDPDSAGGVRYQLVEAGS